MVSRPCCLPPPPLVCLRGEKNGVGDFAGWGQVSYLRAEVLVCLVRDHRVDVLNGNNSFFSEPPPPHYQLLEEVLQLSPPVKNSLHRCAEYNISLFPMREISKTDGRFSPRIVRITVNLGSQSQSPLVPGFLQLL